MRFVVFSGSPAGQDSSTLQYVRFLQKKAPEHHFDIHDVGRRINRFLRDGAAVDRVLEQVRRADGVLWVFPVYVAMVPAQLKQFIEMLFEREAGEVFAGKYTSVITTSVRFYDHTAHDYVEAVSGDLGLNVVRGYSAAYDELLRPEHQRRLCAWFDHVVHCTRERVPMPRRFPAVNDDWPAYHPGEVEQRPRRGAFRVCLVTDVGAEDHNLRRMIRVFRRRLPNPVDVVHLDAFSPAGGCRGCLRCSTSGQCTYRDPFQEVYQRKIGPVDALVYAATIRDRYYSAAFKTYFDRSFFNGHRPIHNGKQIGFLVSGPLSQNPQLRAISEGLADVGGLSQAGMVSDEDPDSARITEQIDGLCQRMFDGLQRDLNRPQTYLGEGGHLIFRDLVYALKPLFAEDHRFYRENNLFNYPQRDPHVRLKRAFFRIVEAIPPLRRQMRKNLTKFKVQPLIRLVDRL